MSDPAKWTVAFSHFTDFVRNLPVLLDEDDVQQYHHIVDLFQHALETDLSRFKVANDRIKRPIQNPLPCWQAKLPERVERAHFVGKIWDFAQYLKSNMAPIPTSTNPN